MTKLALVITLACFVAPLSAQRETFRLTKDETVSIQADRAWEDDSPDIIHFEGKFHLNAGDWSLQADQATVYGKLDQPDTVVLTGSPARINLLVDRGGVQSTVEGEAPNIEYMRSAGSIRMTGGATLSRADNVMTSGEIEYDIDTDRFKTGGSQGVKIRVSPAE